MAPVQQKNGDVIREEPELIDKRVSIEQLKIAYGNLPNSFATVPISVLVISLLEATEAPMPPFLFHWALAATVLTIFRYHYYRKFMEAESPDEEYPYWAAKYSLGLAAAGGFWGVTPMVLFPYTSFEHQVFMTLLIAGLATGVSFAYSAYLRPAKFYMVFSLLPLAIAHFFMGRPANYAIAAMIVFYFFMLWRWLKENNRFGFQAIRTALEKGDLADKLSLMNVKAEEDNMRLRESERKFRSVSETANDAIISVDFEGKVTYWNPAAERMFGYREPEMLGNGVELLMPERYRPAHRRGLASVVAGGPAKLAGKTVRLEGLRKNGDEFPIELSLSAWEAQGAKHFTSIIRDISEMKRAEDELRRRTDELASIIEAQPDILYVINTAGELIKWNSALHKLCGLPPEQMMRRPAADFVCEADRQTVFEGIKEVFGKGYASIEARFIRHDGALVPHLCNGALWKDAEGKPLGFIGVGKDITELRRTQEQLKKSKVSLSKAQEIALLGNWDWDLASREMYWSAQAYRNFGYEPGSISPTYTLMIERVWEGDRHRLKSCFYKALFENAQFDIEVQLADGDEAKYAHLKGEPIFDEKGEPRRLIGTVQDITLIKKMESELRAAKKAAETAAEIKDKFVKLVAHDLRSPFATILGFLNILYSDKAPPLAPQHHEMVERLIQTANNTMKMVDELLNISRLQSGKIILRRHFVPASLLATYAIAASSIAAGKKGISVKNEIPEDIHFYCDVPLLQEVFNNLMSNAVKFCGEGDRIRFHSPSVEKNLVAVSDTGIGINQKFLPDLFRHEVKTTSYGTAQEPGTGLGLPLCADIIKAHHGTISASSEPGKGSTFVISLPKIRPSVLIVDDDRQVRQLLTTLLLKLKCDIRQAADGVEAMKAVHASPPHVVITDIHMPNLDGYELLAELKRDDRYKDIPVIVMTALGAEERSKAFQAGAADFVIKPIDMDELLPRVKRFLAPQTIA